MTYLSAAWHPHALLTDVFPDISKASSFSCDRVTPAGICVSICMCVCVFTPAAFIAYNDMNFIK